VKDIEHFLFESLEKRRQNSTFRSLKKEDTLIDCSSNDYLGFARSSRLKEAIDNEIGVLQERRLIGATGSRLLAGNSDYVETLEQYIADFHRAERGLVFNSGYDANIGVLASIPQKGDAIITDELIHASMIDGARLSLATRYKFKHNDVQDLAKKLHFVKSSTEVNRIFVAVESVYSMDGDQANLQAMVAVCKEYDANLIVDEAHATGVFEKQGRGLVNLLGLENDIFARVVTFGKALGCHGAIVLGSNLLRSYLINFARAFIYTTAAPTHTHISVKCAYDWLQSSDFSNERLHQLIRFFKQELATLEGLVLIDSHSAIQCIIIPGNERCRMFASRLQTAGLDIRPILSPTVPKGKERLRICLHSFNTEAEIIQIKEVLQHSLKMESSL
jgi:8-amino-7-oxononanoate synthase